MEISLNAPNQLTVQGSLSNATTRVAGTATGSSQTVQPKVVSPSSIQPEPVIRVNNQAQIESPFIDITQQISENREVENAQPTSVSPPDTTRSQIQDLTLEQSSIQERQDSLESEQRQIDREINDLERRELEINRKKFELQRQSALGNIINISI